jgi:hypothetical protein
VDAHPDVGRCMAIEEQDMRPRVRGSVVLYLVG